MSIRFGRSGNGYDSSEVMETEDDDWRKVTDLNERRKIQNRLAQRNYRRKLRQRLEQLERQAGENGTTSAASVEPTNNSSKRRGRRLSVGVDGTSSRAGEKYVERNTTRKVSNLEDRSLTRSPVLSSVVPIESSNSRAAESVPQNLYAGDFGPLLTGPDVRQRGTQQPSQQLQIWPQPYHQPQQQEYGQSLQQSYYHASSPPSFPITPISHTESTTSPSQQIQAYISLLPNDPPLPVSSSLIHRGEVFPSDTHISYRLNARAGINPSGFPDLSPTYSANPSVNPNPYHLNGTPLPTGDFYLTLNYITMINATMEIARILQVSEVDMIDDDTISPFVISDSSKSPLRLPEGMEDLEPTKKQTTVVHHPYVDIIPFKGYRDRLLEYVRYGNETGDVTREEKMCAGMCDSWGVWGQVPWERRSWEVGEAFARKYWFLMDDELIRCSNWWRRQRGMKPLRIQELRETGRLMAEGRPTDWEEIGRLIEIE